MCSFLPLCAHKAWCEQGWGSLCSASAPGSALFSRHFAAWEPSSEGILKSAGAHGSFRGCGGSCFAHSEAHASGWFGCVSSAGWIVLLSAV